MSTQETTAQNLRDVPFHVTPRQVHKFVGLTALCLPIVLFLVPLSAPVCFMSSISHFYYTPIGGDLLVGALSVIGAIMLLFYAYKGDDGADNSAYSLRNARLAKIAGLCALGVAFVPTANLGCPYEGEASRFLIEATTFTTPESAPRSIYVPGATAEGMLTADFPKLLGWPGFMGAVHYLSALGMFLILGYFSFFVFTQVQTPAARAGGNELTAIKRTRNRLYRAAGGIIFFAIAALAVKVGLETLVLDEDSLLRFREWWNGLYLTFLFEALALIAFGISWLVKARIFGWFEDERSSQR